LIDLPGRGSTFVRQADGPPGAPTVVLSHGWLATADLNWGFSYPHLAEHFRVVALDQRGHGRGLRSTRRFSFADSADDVVALADVLGIDRFVAVGYSMGGPVALELGRRHPDRVSGLVLCATAAAFTSSPVARFWLSSLGPVASATRVLPNTRFRAAARERFITRRAEGPWQHWISSELAPSDPTTMLEAGAALGTFNASHWARHLTVPSSVVVTTRDSLVAPESQRALVRALPRSETFPVDADHLACFDQPEAFVPVLIDACHSVVRRAAT
jgi:3-oxoadipate enol-lactonase